MARNLNQQEITELLNHISTKRHAFRDKAILMLFLYAGMTAKEVSSLELCQVITSDGSVANEIDLGGRQTRAGKERKVYLTKQVQAAIKRYLCDRFGCNDLLPLLLTDTKRPLFINQKSTTRGFSANTLAGHFCKLMTEAGVHDASSYSLRKSYSIKLAERAIPSKLLAMIGESSELVAIADRIASNPEALKLLLRV